MKRPRKLHIIRFGPPRPSADATSDFPLTVATLDVMRHIETVELTSSGADGRFHVFVDGVAESLKRTIVVVCQRLEKSEALDLVVFGVEDEGVLTQEWRDLIDVTGGIVKSPNEAFDMNQLQLSGLVSFGESNLGFIAISHHELLSSIQKLCNFSWTSDVLTKLKVATRQSTRIRFRLASTITDIDKVIINTVGPILDICASRPLSVKSYAALELVISIDTFEFCTSRGIVSDEIPIKLPRVDPKNSVQGPSILVWHCSKFNKLVAKLMISDSCLEPASILGLAWHPIFGKPNENHVDEECISDLLQKVPGMSRENSYTWLNGFPLPLGAIEALQPKSIVASWNASRDFVSMWKKGRRQRSTPKREPSDLGWNAYLLPGRDDGLSKKSDLDHDVGSSIFRTIAHDNMWPQFPSRYYSRPNTVPKPLCDAPTIPDYVVIENVTDGNENERTTLPVETKSVDDKKVSRKRVSAVALAKEKRRRLLKEQHGRKAN